MSILDNAFNKTLARESAKRKPIILQGFGSNAEQEARRVAIETAVKARAVKAEKVYPYLFGMVNTGSGETRQYFARDMSKEKFGEYCSEQYRQEEIDEGYTPEGKGYYTPEFILTSDTAMTLSGHWFC
jgi:hypothetical protein